MTRGLRFVIAGGLNTAACYAVYAILVGQGVDFRLANFLSLVFGICCNFILQGRFVFDDPDPSRFGRFALLWLTIYCAQTAMIWMMVAGGIDPRLAGLIVLPGIVVLSFVMQRTFVFRAAAR